MRVVEPALPRPAVSATSKTYEPDFEEWLGAKVISVEPRRSPDTAAPLIAAEALTAERCCASRPGFRRPARMFTRRMCRAVMIERLRAVRRISPPPSPCAPSSVRTSIFTCHTASVPLTNATKISITESYTAGAFAYQLRGSCPSQAAIQRHQAFRGGIERLEIK